MTRIAALHTQKAMRDLAGLSRLCEEIDWCSPDRLATTTDPAVLVGMWLYEAPADSRRLLTSRAAAGLTTILVPRFKAGDLHSFIKAPSAVQLTIGEYAEFRWDDGKDCDVPGQTIIKTNLHAGQWGGIAGLGTTVLAFREHEAAGWIVVCTAGVTSRQFGVEVESQRSLLEQILFRAKVTSPSIVARQVTDPTNVAPIPASELLATEDSKAAAILLALALGDGVRDTQSIAQSLNRIGFEVSEDAIEWTLSHLIEQSVDELESALRQYGWGAHLRRGRLVFANGGDE